MSVRELLLEFLLRMQACFPQLGLQHLLVRGVATTLAEVVAELQKLVAAGRLQMSGTIVPGLDMYVFDGRAAVTATAAELELEVAIPHARRADEARTKPPAGAWWRRRFAAMWALAHHHELMNAPWTVRMEQQIAGQGKLAVFLKGRAGEQVAVLTTKSPDPAAVKRRIEEALATAPGHRLLFVVDLPENEFDPLLDLQVAGVDFQLARAPLHPDRFGTIW